MRLIDIDKAFKNLSQMYEEADGSKKRALRFLLDEFMGLLKSGKMRLVNFCPNCGANMTGE